ncbi:Translation initiation factor 3 [Macleaya cordata]|uniref:Translation initiation factor 3 n=1 Tax=Macleaya cordata TaxID=56857 RepID=A0A200PZ35_MACCD|nr:Translation initiation factor 3 [Macleaya cordata]
MVFWSRIRHLKFEGLSHQCKRWYCQIPGVSSTYYIAGKMTIKVFEKPNSFTCRRPTDLYSAVRSFAAPVQAKPKPEPKDSSGPRLNNQITAEFVRLVSDEGHVVVSRREALNRARKLQLDLVEVQRAADPPVCKIMDFHREQYKQQVKDKERVKGKSEVTLRKGDCKEVRFKGKTEQKDLQMKADMAKRLMEKGYRVKCTAMGTEDQDLGGLLSRLSAMIEDISVVESGPRVERRQAYVIVRHIKFGPPKKLAKVSEPTKIDFVKEATSPSTISISSHIQSPDQIEENWEPEDEIIPDQAESPIASSMKRTDGKLGESKKGWSSFDASEVDFEKVFDFDGSGTGKSISFTDGRMDSAAGSPYPQQETRSVQTKSVPSPVIKPSFEGQNRYNSRSETRTDVLPTKSTIQRIPTDINRRPPAPGSMDSGRVPQFSDQHKLPPTSTTRASPSLEQKQELGNGASTFRTLKQPPVVDETPAQGGHSRRGSPPSPSPTPTPSYGIFSVPKPTNLPNNQNSATEVTREVNSTKQKTESGQRPEANKTREGGWGIFSRDATSSAK